jgi:hypothetical protein
VLNARLYRTCWLIAGVALVVALLTLEAPNPGPEAALPSSIDGQSTLELESQLAAIAPERAPGSGPDIAAARWVQGQLSQVPGVGRHVQLQDFVARHRGGLVRLQNVYLAVPAAPGSSPRGGVLVVAPRDTPAGVAAGASSTAVMLQLARVSATLRHSRPLLFVSTDGSTVGNAGIRWFLDRFSSFPISAAVVLDAPGDAEGDRIRLWTDGTARTQALGIGQLAARSVARSGGRADADPSLGAQVLRLAVPQSFGDQGPLIAAGVPAVTMSGRRESPLRPAVRPTADRLALAANSANDLLGALDAAPQVPAPDTSVTIAGKRLRPTFARMALLLLALPVLVLAVDAVARSRRARVPMGAGLRAVALRTAPLFAGLAAAHLLSMAGLLPRPSAGLWPIPADARFGPAAALGLVLAAAAGVLGWMWARRRTRALAATPPAEGAAAIGALAVLLVVLWIVSPYALVLVLPAAHAALVATGAQRRWHLAALAGIAVLPLLALVISLSGDLDSNPVFATWYLLETAASGARGWVGVVLAVLVTGCIWSLGAFVAFRARKGGLAAAAEGAAAAERARRRPRRPPRRLGPRPRRAG